ncbi:Protein of unknwon function [Nocardia farcinica]|uniref:Protein of unknwon function (DUF3310) n=1 Tax=Nocardia farcinica TaxID=37329 RepID=A0A0H5NXS0_NOCFR|nr:DUF3310 domain-containing protein [Nocardia farcinica]AXK86561.1 DUF3310 domain-containing protein [Nocardia farcinica]PFW99033.1 hypothetical protein CJ469_05633 [Nocardia farcinica]PFX06071.1 hypothetical protein CJ468_04931 [Nocardia farcinica]CRY79839.1 Protein of unknwon function (DUF3310) [Nocardia farcinica]SIT33588.1 Protein of unknwon function [Nocardia farcinica]
MPDPVNPGHYQSHPSGIEPKDFLGHFPFFVGSAIKYLWRNGQKDGNPAVQDLRKAIRFIEFEIEKIEGRKVDTPQVDTTADTYTEEAAGCRVWSRLEDIPSDVLAVWDSAGDRNDYRDGWWFYRNADGRWTRSTNAFRPFTERP